MNKRIALISVAAVAAVAFFGVWTTFSGRRADARPDAARFTVMPRPEFARAAAFGVSPRVADLKPAIATSVAPEPKIPSQNFVAPPDAVKHDADAALAAPSALPMPSPSLSVPGLSNRENTQINGFYYLPSDTNGDVGPNHYVQTVNALMRVYDKSGASVTPPFRISSLFAPLGTVCAQRDDGEAVVLYDPLADRWLLSQYCSAFPPFRQMIAVSQTGDPAGSYFLYEFVMPNVRLNDYAKFGVWSDAYLMTDEEFVGQDFTGSGIFAFDRAKILRGDASAGYVYFNVPSASAARFGSFLPADLDGLRAPPAGAPGLFASYMADEYGAPFDAVRLFELRADFANPSSSTFAERPESPLAVAAFDPTSPADRADILQPAPGEALDSQSDRLMYRVAYRNFGASESIVVNQTVRTSAAGAAYRAGVRVHELRRGPATSGAFAIANSTTFGDADASRWMAAAAQDHQGDVAFGYSLGNDDKAAAPAYSGRLATDAPGAFRSDGFLAEATGVQSAFGNRWGNFTGMVVDPVDDCTFWLTNQYFTAESQLESPFSWLTRIGRFKFAECAPAPRAGLKVKAFDAVTNAPLAAAEVTVAPADSSAPYFRRTLADGFTERMLVLPGTVVVTASLRGYRSQSLGTVLGNDPNGTVFVGLPLTPVPVVEKETAQIASESCAPNRAVEPGETATLNLALKNTGATATTNLTATLVATGGVLNPSAPQIFGALAPGGSSATRSFTFTAAPNRVCGAPLELRLALRDGAADLGVVTVALAGGALRTAFSENFDGQAAPALPAGWTTSVAGGAQLWAASTDQRESLPNSVFSPAPNQAGVNELTSPAFQVSSPDAAVEFRNWYDLETTFLRNRLYDGAVLEINIGNDRWQDIEEAGGTFTAGGYDGAIDSCCSNPLAGRRGWSGRSGADATSQFITTRAKLPAAAAGRSVRLRWRVGTDIGTFRTGQYIDDLVVADGFACGCANSQAFRAPFDFDGDGRTDLGVFRPTDAPNASDFVVARSSDGGSADRAWGAAGDAAVASDYDGDGKTDYAVFRPSNATWYVLRSFDGGVSFVNFGLAADRPAPADYDGDGKSDIAVFRASEGTWYIRRSSDGQIAVRRFGLAGDLAVPADYDGDGRADIAVFRPSDGLWYVLRSSDDGFSATRFGLAGDRPVAGDFDGDGRSDFAVFRPSDKNWYVLASTAGFSATNFGLSSDVPLAADFDGDGRRDIAVFRPATGAWYHLRSADSGFVARTFGGATDTALPSIFVP